MRTLESMRSGMVIGGRAGVAIAVETFAPGGARAPWEERPGPGGLGASPLMAEEAEEEADDDEDWADDDEDEDALLDDDDEEFLDDDEAGDDDEDFDDEDLDIDEEEDDEL